MWKTTESKGKENVHQTLWKVVTLHESDSIRYLPDLLSMRSVGMVIDSSEVESSITIFAINTALLEYQ